MMWFTDLNAVVYAVAAYAEPASVALAACFVAGWLFRPETPEQTEERHRRECEAYRDNDALL